VARVAALAPERRPTAATDPKRRWLGVRAQP
jgi:hypothetical protein